MNGRYPKRFEDDGTDVTVDLHGCSVLDAVHIIRRTVQEANRRGRARVVVIHGKSGDGEGASKRTIKNELSRMLEKDDVGSMISGSTQDAAGGQTTLWMTIGPKPIRSQIRVRDVVR